MGIIEAILAVAKQLFGLRTELEKTKQARGERIARYLEAVAGTVTEVATELRLGRVPHGKCAEMATHADHLAETVGDALDAETVRKLADALKAARNVEGLYYELRNAQRDPADIVKLDEAAGIFRALATVLRAS